MYPPGALMTKAAVDVVPPRSADDARHRQRGTLQVRRSQPRAHGDGRCLDDRHRRARSPLLQTMIADARRALEHAEPTIVTRRFRAWLRQESTRQRIHARVAPNALPSSHQVLAMVAHDSTGRRRLSNLARHAGAGAVIGNAVPDDSGQKHHCRPAWSERGSQCPGRPWPS